jgi:hypothetical protein
MTNFASTGREGVYVRLEPHKRLYQGHADEGKAAKLIMYTPLALKYLN